MMTGPTGHVEECTVDLQLKAVRRCIYAREVLLQECVAPLDVQVPYWGFNEKFIMVG